MLPTLFISHGAPSLPLETSAPTYSFMQGLLSGLKPRAILVASAHWEEPRPTLTSAARLGTIHDFYGFPDELYRMRYEARGEPALAKRAAALLSDAGIEGGVDSERGLDHGAWSPLYLAAPKADIPVVQLSLDASLDASRHLALGRALAPLREEGVLIVGSGGAVHNLRALDWNQFSGAKTAPGALEFQGWLDAAMASPARSKLLSEWQAAPNARMAHPREEHFMPLHVAVGAAENERAVKIHDAWQMGNMSMAAWRLG